MKGERVGGGQSEQSESSIDFVLQPQIRKRRVPKPGSA